MKREMLIATLLVTATAASALAQIRIPVSTTTYTLTDLHPANVPAQWDSLARAIDNTGRAVGQSENAAHSEDAFQTLPNAPFVSGTSDDLGRLAGDGTSQAWAINKNGLIVGISMGGTESQRAFLFTPGSGLVNLNTSGSLGSLVISNAASIGATASMTSGGSSVPSRPTAKTRRISTPTPSSHSARDQRRFSTLISAARRSARPMM